MRTTIWLRIMLICTTIWCQWESDENGEPDFKSLINKYDFGQMDNDNHENYDDGDDDDDCGQNMIHLCR